METTELIIKTVLALLALVNVHRWYKAETGSLDRIEYCVCAFGFTILLAS